VRAVVEVHVVGQVVDLQPLHRLARREAVTHRRELRALAPYLAVAVHTRRRRRDGGVRCLLDGVVAVAAIHAHLADVQLVAVGHRLRWLVTDVGRGRSRPVPNQANQVEGRRAQEQAGELTCFIGPTRKDEEAHEDRPKGLADGAFSSRLRGGVGVQII
jgi:hypothetical protein